MLQNMATEGPQNPIPVEIAKQFEYILAKLTELEARIEALEGDE